MYLLLTSFVIIASLVADVPIPLPFICSRSSSSSISCPAFSIARIIEPDVYLFGGLVFPSFISKPLQESTAPLRSLEIYSITSSLAIWSSEFSALPSDASFAEPSPLLWFCLSALSAAFSGFATAR